jgi:riboflavin synthase
MFTGLIEEVGTVVAVRAGDRGVQLRPQVPSTRRRSVLQIVAPHIAKEIRTGDSVAVNGCCLTLSSHGGDQLTFDLLEETINCTNLKGLRPNSPVNLERALSADGRFGGHLVQGHIDCTSPILAFEERGGDHRLEVQLPAGFAHYVVSKGSIAINGISLTVAEVLPKSFVVGVVPHTKRHTNLDRAKAGDLLNLEFDILAKYVERMLPRMTKHE